MGGGSVEGDIGTGRATRWRHTVRQPRAVVHTAPTGPCRGRTRPLRNTLRTDTLNQLGISPLISPLAPHLSTNLSAISPLRCPVGQLLGELPEAGALLCLHHFFPLCRLLCVRHPALELCLSLRLRQSRLPLGASFAEHPDGPHQVVTGGGRAEKYMSPGPPRRCDAKPRRCLIGVYHLQSVSMDMPYMLHSTWTHSPGVTTRDGWLP